MKSAARVSWIVTLLWAMLQTEFLFAQPAMPVPRQSPAATVAQTIGITEVRITYHRPAVKGRKVWGDLVPYNQVWRAGANENTTITFGRPVKVNGRDLPAGTYGLHMIPREGEWTIIFNKNATSWGSFFYNESEDALRTTAKPEASPFEESLKYEFGDLTNSSATVSLRWENLRIPFSIDLDVHSAVLANAREAYLRGPAGFTWQGFNQAANYCLQNNVNLEEAFVWVERSISINQNFTNLRVKAGLLEKQGKTAEAKAIRDQALLIATEADVNALGYEHLAANHIKEAIDVFRKNVKEYPDSWNVYDSLAEAHERNGDKRLAIEYYTKALSMVKDDTNKRRITETLQRLSAK